MKDSEGFRKSLDKVYLLELQLISLVNSFESMTDNTKNIVTTIILLFLYPIGLVLMWFWVSWPGWVKVLISIPMILGILGILATMLLVTADPSEQMDKTREQSELYQQKLELDPNSTSEPLF